MCSSVSVSPAAAPQTTPATYPHCPTETRKQERESATTVGIPRSWTISRDEWGPPMELDRRPPRGRARVHRLQGVRGVSAGQHRALTSGRTVGGPDGVLASGEDGTATSDSGRAGPPHHVLTTGPAWTCPSGKMRGSPPSTMWLKDAGGAGRSVGKERNRPSQTRYQLLGPVLQLFRLSARDRRLLPPCGC